MSEAPVIAEASTVPPVSRSIPVVVGKPYNPQQENRNYYQEERANLLPQNNAIPVDVERQQLLLSILGIQCGLVFLAILDVVLLTIMSFYNIYYLVLLWGPILGLIGNVPIFKFAYTTSNLFFISSSRRLYF